MKELDLKKYLETGLFLSVISVLNENSFDSYKWDEKTRQAVEKYRETFYRKNYFDYSLIMKEMLIQLESNMEFAETIKSKIKYLTVDEYQDTNPIQERLIAFIKQGGCNLCIVGDDDQTIYQFRGSDPNNILTFKERYNIKKYIVLDTDYRSTEDFLAIFIYTRLKFFRSFLRKSECNYVFRKYIFLLFQNIYNSSCNYTCFTSAGTCNYF